MLSARSKIAPALIWTCMFLTKALAAVSLATRATTPFVNPTAAGGSWLDDAGDGLGEPLNVVISALSSPAVLTDDGFLNFAQSIGFSTECFGVHLGGPQSANLGDGQGPQNQTVELRMDFGSAGLGTCLESLIGGNHLRVFRQNGPTANTGALFLAVSQEENLSQQHTISPDGYDVGRDKLVAAATGGQTSHNGVTYQTTSQTLTGLVAAGSNGINHGIAIDGVVQLLTVTIV